VPEVGKWEHTTRLYISSGKIETPSGTDLLLAPGGDVDFNGGNLKNAVNIFASETITNKIGTADKTVMYGDGSNLTGVVGVATGWQLAEKITVAADTTDVDMTGLDIDADDAYWLILDLKNPLTTDTTYRMYFNADTTDTNYWRQFFDVTGTALSSMRVNNPTTMWNNVGLSLMAYFHIIRPGDGKTHWWTCQEYHTGNSLVKRMENGEYQPNVNITQITIHATKVGGIGAGSRILRFRVVS